MRLCTLTVMNTQPDDCLFLLEPQKLGDADQSVNLMMRKQRMSQNGKNVKFEESPMRAVCMRGRDIEQVWFFN